MDEIPKWYNENSSDEDYLLASNTQVSQDLQLAINKATAGARTEIARMVKVHVTNLQKPFIEEVGNSKDSQVGKLFSDTSELITSESLSGSIVSNKQFMKEGDTFRAYVLVKYPIGKANAAFLEKLKTQEYLNTIFRATKAYDELEKKVVKYESSKKE